MAGISDWKVGVKSVGEHAVMLGWVLFGYITTHDIKFCLQYVIILSICAPKGTKVR